MDTNYEYNLLMASLHVSVSKHLMDEFFTVVWANEYFYESTLYTREEYEAIYHNQCSTYFKQDMEEFNKFATAIHKAVADGQKGYEVICKMPQKGGSYIWIKIVGTFSEERINGIPVIYSTFTDVTDVVEQRQLQKELEKRTIELADALEEAKKANSAKSDFFSKMSHDIRTPLNAILGMKDIALTHLNDQGKVEDCLNKIGLSGQHLLGLINDVLDMSKIESGKMVLNHDIVPLPDVMENVVAIMQPAFKNKKQNFSIRLHKVIHEHFYSDALRLRQILLNILSNAGKFTPEGGSVTLDVEEQMTDNPDMSLIIFTISDTGRGMKPEFLEHLFDAFCRERDSRVDTAEGTGLGMAITHKIVEILDGAIQVESKEGEGTTFSVTLPMKIENEPLMDQRFPDLKIIVADDDVIMCEYTVDMLNSLGIHAEWVNSGTDALEKISQAQERGEDFDAILLDWKMPDMDGLLTTRRIHEICGDKLPVIIISAYDWGDIEEEAHGAGARGFLSKPLFISTLCKGLKRHVLGEKSGLTPVDERLSKICFTGKQILLVEDNALNREVAEELLSYTGASIYSACSGSDGIKMFQTSIEGYFDIILMDIQMPGIDGYEAARTIRRMDRKDAGTIPIIAMTADAFAEDIIAAQEAGMNGHIAKPLDLEVLRREIKKYIS